MAVFFFGEMVIFTMIIAANTVFMLFRSCFKHKLLPESKLPLDEQLRSVDTLVALKLVLNKFTNQFVPFSTTIIIFFENLFGEPLIPQEMLIYKVCMITGTLSFIDNFLQLFVSWKKGPRCWRKFAPYFYLFNLHCTYVLYPLGMITLIIQ